MKRFGDHFPSLNKWLNMACNFIIQGLFNYAKIQTYECLTQQKQFESLSALTCGSLWAPCTEKFWSFWWWHFAWQKFWTTKYAPSHFRWFLRTTNYREKCTSRIRSHNLHIMSHPITTRQGLGPFQKDNLRVWKSRMLATSPLSLLLSV